MEGLKYITAEQPQFNILDLIYESQQGNLAAFAELVRFYQKKAYGLAYSFLKNHHDAEDISQEAFVKAFENLGSFDRTRSFNSWFLTIVANLSKNKIRWKKVRERFTFSLDAVSNDSEKDGQAMQVADRNPQIDPILETGHTILAENLNRALDGLPTQQRTAIQLKMVEGYKISEVANVMNLAEGTVKTHIFRGMEKLKKNIGESRYE